MSKNRVINSFNEFWVQVPVIYIFEFISEVLNIIPLLLQNTHVPVSSDAGPLSFIDCLLEPFCHLWEPWDKFFEVFGDYVGYFGHYLGLKSG